MNLTQRAPHLDSTSVITPGPVPDLVGEYHHLLLTAIEELDNTEFCRTGRRSARARELRGRVAVLERAVPAGRRA